MSCWDFVQERIKHSDIQFGGGGVALFAFSNFSCNP